MFSHSRLCGQTVQEIFQFVTIPSLLDLHAEAIWVLGVLLDLRFKHKILTIEMFTNYNNNESGPVELITREF